MRELVSIADVCLRVDKEKASVAVNRCQWKNMSNANTGDFGWEEYIKETEKHVCEISQS